jgi:predicted nucleic acid-binding protein
MIVQCTVAWDTNTLRFRFLIPFLVKHLDRFRVIVPTVVYAETGYSYLRTNRTFKDLDDEIASYDGEVLSLTIDQVQKAIVLANENKAILPFREHNRDYLIAGQLDGAVDVFITYNKRHFAMIAVKNTRLLSPEEFISEYTA